MNLNIIYETPKKQDICVAFVSFNACGYLRPLQNQLLFKNKLVLAKIPFFSAEVIIGDTPKLNPDANLTLKSSCPFFYKEAAWNALEKIIPDVYTKIVFCDADIIFNDPEWCDKVSTVLDTCDIMQPFDTCVYLDASFKPTTKIKKSRLLCIAKNETNKNAHGGFGLAIRRDFLKSVNGFFDKMLIGGGDTVLCHFLEKKELYITVSPIMRNFAFKYYSEFKKKNPRIGYIENIIVYHLYHGDMSNRNYINRHKILLSCSYLSWDELFYQNADNLWESKSDRLIETCKQYFAERKEDDIQP